MDPNHWGNLNPQYAARLGAAGLSGNPGAIPAFLESHSLAGTGLGAPPSTHSTLPPPHITGISPVPYSHSLTGSMSHILDSLSAGQSQYKTVTVGQPAYSLVESPSRVVASQAAMYAAQSKVSLFNTDPHTMREAAHTHAANTPSPDVDTEPRSWTTTTFQGPTMTSLLSQAQDAHRSTGQAPPPAHSGHGRPSAVQKISFTKTDYPAAAQESRPRQAHSNNYGQESGRSHMLEEMLKPVPGSQQPPQAHSNSHQTSVLNQHRPLSGQTNQRVLYNDPHSRTVSVQQYQDPVRSNIPQPTYEASPPVISQRNTYQESTPFQQNPQQQINVGRAQQMPMVKALRVAQPQSQPPQSIYNAFNPQPGGFHSTTPHNTAQYEAVSPPPNEHDNHGNDGRSGQSTSLQDFANISAHQQKIPMSDNTTPPRLIHSSLAQQQNSGSMLDGNHNHQQPSTIPPVSVHNSACAIVTQNTPIQHPTVQAQADSTTKPKRGGRKAGARSSRSNSGSNKKKRNEESAVSQPNVSVSGGVAPPNMYPMGSVAEPYQPMPGSYSTISAEHIGLSHLSPLSAMAQQMISQHQEMPQPVFMTNTFGNAFVTPKNDCMVKDDTPAMQDHNQNPLLDSEQELMLSQYSPTHKQLRTKAEQKQMPSTSVVDDDEFCHLDANNAQPKHVNGKPDQCEITKNSPNYLTANPHGKPHNNPQCKPPGNPQMESQNDQSIVPVPKTKSKDTSFQSSFLSFLQGNKQETLSSVTNSAITNKPQLPKYVPEAARPKPPALPVNRALSTVTKLKESTPPQPKPTLDAVTFSDDEDSDSIANKNVSKTVNKVLSNLDEASKEAAVKGCKVVLPSLASTPKSHGTAANKTAGAVVKPSASNTPIYRIISSTPAATPKPKTKTPAKSRFKARKGSSIDDEPPTLKPKAPEIALDEVLPPREKSSRKAKEKLEEKRKAKKKRRKREYSDESDTEDDDYQPSSSISDSEPDERNYDSDKDPVWTPFAQDFASTTVDYEDDDRGRRGKQKKRAKSPVGRAPKRGRRGSTGLGSTCSPYDLAPTKPQAVGETVLEFLSDDDEPPHTFQKGCFVIDRRDLARYTDFPIWKVDAGKLLQKFEYFTKDGKTLHKSLSTYSSWSDNIRERYKAIAATWIQKGAERDQDLVEVHPDYVPHPVDESMEEDATMQAFNVYVQILVSQALEPGFLPAIQNEEDDYYAQPMQLIDQLLTEKKKLIATRVKWTTSLQESVEKYPFLSMGDKDESVNQSRPLLRAIQLSGDPYIRDTLEEAEKVIEPESPRTSKEFLIGHVIAQCVRTYHTLHHYKYILHKRCLSKVNLLRGNGQKDQSDVLDQCLQNRAWVHKLYTNLQKLLDRATADSSTSSSPPAPVSHHPPTNTATS